MILIPKRQELVVPARLTLGMKGLQRLQLINKFSGKCRVDTGFIPNKLLDSGRNQMAQRGDWMNFAQLGTNSTPPSASDTGLLGRVAGTATINATSNGAQASAPYYGWKRKTFRFPVGAGQGGQNLSEGGVGWSASGASLVSRALLLDPLTGDPTTVTPLADELVDLTYELRYYPPAADANQTVTLNGVSYDVIHRASEVNNGTFWGSHIGEEIGNYSVSVGDWAAFDGDIGTVVQAPSGGSVACDNADQFDLTYQNNSYEVDMQCNTGTTGWNLGSGIRSIRIMTTAGNYQSQFNATSGGARIPKTTGFSMIMVWTLGWTEVP
jgi:hypothetical protein